MEAPTLKAQSSALGGKATNCANAGPRIVLGGKATKNLSDATRRRGIFTATHDFNVIHPQTRHTPRRDTPYKFKLFVSFCMGCLAWGYVSSGGGLR